MKPPLGRVEVRRRMTASAERVFAAFGEAELVARWLTPSPDVKLTVLGFDFRVGGAYRFVYDTPDGQRMLVGGTFRIIERPTRLVFSWLIDPPDVHAGIPSEVTVSITPLGAEAELVIQHDKLEREDAVARHAEGWAGALAQLARIVTARSSQIMIKRIGLGALAYLIPTFLLGFFWHLVFFKGYYDALAMYRHDVIIPFGFLSMSIQAVLFAWTYDSLFAGRTGGTVKRGFGYAGFGAALSWSFTTIARGGQERDDLRSRLPPSSRPAFTAVQWLMVGPLTSLLLEPRGAQPSSA